MGTSPKSGQSSPSFPTFYIHQIIFYAEMGFDCLVHAQLSVRKFIDLKAPIIQVAMFERLNN